MLSQEVQTKDGVSKLVYAPTEEELTEAVAVAENDQAAVAPDLDNQEDANKVVSPDNTHTLEGVGGVSVNGVPENRN